ncbi:MAG TPA: glycosyltransferase [Acidimicrobiia bacterium]|nr:glycosyltransferase [Acidimicrobiia bacterium]
MAPSITIVVPVFNEADFIPQALPLLIDAVEGVGIEYSILIVENGSSDGSAEVAARVAGDANVIVESLPEPDYGAAMRHGFMKAGGDWVVNFDIDYFSGVFLADLITQPESIDLVIGSKRDPLSEDRRPLIRRLATRVFNLLLKVILGSKVTDTHGMKGFRRELVADIAPKVVSTKDLFDTELVVRAERAGYAIAEVPVVVEEMRTARSSLIKRAPRTIAGLIRMRALLREPSDATGIPRRWRSVRRRRRK